VDHSVEPRNDVLIDLDGTLTDPGVGITRCIIHALERLGRPSPDASELRRYVGPPLAETFRELLGNVLDEQVTKAIALYRERFSTVGWFENHVYPEIPETLATLRQRGHRLRVVTSKPTIFSERILRHFDLAQHFAGIHGSELDGTRSDKGELVAHVLETERIDPETAVMVGDRTHDVVGARKNRVRSIGVLWGYGSIEELRTSGASMLVSTPVELLSALDRRRD
jgi:phosphoglycolate phosphatase